MDIHIGNLRFGISLNLGRFTGGSIKGRFHFYASVTLGRRTFFVSRWDIDRVKTKRYLSLDGVMCWYWGSFKVKRA